MGRSRFFAPSPRTMYTVGKDVLPCFRYCPFHDAEDRCNEDHDTGDFGYRDHKDDLLGDIETGRHLQALQEVPQLTRMLLESNEWHVQLDPRFQITKVIRRRADENLQPADLADPDPEDPEAIDPEDALAPGRWEQMMEEQSSEDEPGEDLDNANVPAAWVKAQPMPRPPKDRWDLIYDNNAEQPDGSRGFSAQVFPTLQWKNRSAAVRHWTRLIEQGEELPSPRTIWHVTQELSPGERSRIWQIYKIQKFLRERSAKEISDGI